MKGGYNPLWGFDYRVNDLEIVNSLALPYALTSSFTDSGVSGTNARSNVGYWRGNFVYSDLTALALTEDVKVIEGFPAKYKILEIMVNNVAVWDDGVGPISAVTLSVGWTGPNYDDLIQTQDIYTAVTQIGDAAGELNYTAVQGGIRPSWSTPTDLYLRFVAVGGNLNTLTSGRCVIYITYQAYE